MCHSFLTIFLVTLLVTPLVTNGVQNGHFILLGCFIATADLFAMTYL